MDHNFDNHPYESAESEAAAQVGQSFRKLLRRRKDGHLIRDF